MVATANVTKPKFIMALGDNFYTEGVQSTSDSLWKTMYRDVYFNQFNNTQYQDTLKGIPWHPAFGNHDIGYGATGIAAQINRTTTTTDDDNGEWQMPSPYYTVKYDIPGGGYVQVIVVDTTTLSPSVTRETSEVSTSIQAARLTTQLKALMGMFQKTLQSPRPTWLLVMGHYQMFSYGEKGDNSELFSYLQPFLSHYGVHAYFCGHDHMNEHLQYGNTEYYVAGASTMIDYLEDGVSSAADLVWVGEGYAAFVRASATPSALKVEYVNTNGTIVYAYTLTNSGVDKSTWQEKTGTGKDETHSEDSSAPELEKSIITGAQYAVAAIAFGFAAFQIWIYWMFSGVGYSEYNLMPKNSDSSSGIEGGVQGEWSVPSSVPNPMRAIDMTWNSAKSPEEHHAAPPPLLLLFPHLHITQLTPVQAMQAVP
jgi:hypothetical protein